MERLLECCLEKFPHVSSLKDEQKEAVIHLLRSKDVVAILPTGFGKSLIYQLYAAAKEMQIQDVVVLVVSPLKSIMMDQIEEMEELEIPSIVLSTNDDVLQKIGEVKYTLVFGAAEDFLDPKFQNVLKSEGSPLHSRVSLIVVDECHTVETW